MCVFLCVWLLGNPTCLPVLSLGYNQGVGGNPFILVGRHGRIGKVTTCKVDLWTYSDVCTVIGSCPVLWYPVVVTL